MSSRQEEKEARRRERIAQEQEAASAAARKRRLGIVAAAVLGLAALAAVAVALLSGGDDDKKASDSGRPATGQVAIPAAKLTNLDEAAKAAGCVVRTFPSEGQTHTTSRVKYKTNPPTSGGHDPEPAQDGIYEPGQQPTVGKLVHSLEHGRINVQYQPGLAAKRVDQLETLVSEQDGYHALLYQNDSRMPHTVAATAWTRMLGCRQMNDRTFDAIRAFRKRFTDKAPEFVP